MKKQMEIKTASGNKLNMEIEVIREFATRVKSADYLAKAEKQRAVYEDYEQSTRKIRDAMNI